MGWRLHEIGQDGMNPLGLTSNFLQRRSDFEPLVVQVFTDVLDFFRRHIFSQSSCFSTY